jgi:hypothetical protein
MYYTPETLLNHVFEDLWKPKAPNIMYKLDFNIGGVSMDKPINVKPKGRTIRNDEVRTVKLGAKGEKKMNRRCKKCGVADGHNSRTCLSIEENRARLVILANPRKKRVSAKVEKH